MPGESGQYLELGVGVGVGQQEGALLLETGGKEAGGRALTGQWLWGWADK